MKSFFFISNLDKFFFENIFFIFNIFLFIFYTQTISWTTFTSVTRGTIFALF
jgi:hypothetical protein